MSEKTDNGGDISPSQSLGTLPSDWEERLAIARAQREKVLKAKGKAKKARPRFLDAGLGVETNPFSGLSGENAPKTKAPRNNEDFAQPIEPARGALASTAQPASWLAGQPVSRIMVIGFACFFGLGCGMVLSFSAVASMGLFSWNEITAEQPDLQIPIKPSAPETYSLLGFAGLEAFSPIEAEAEFTYASLTQVTTGTRHVQKLVAFETDLDLVTVRNPAPRLGITAVSRELVSSPSQQPAEIAVDFVKPASFPVQVAPPKPMDLFGDVVPQLPERSTIRAPKMLASFNPPQAGQLTLSTPLNSPAVFQRNQTPSPLRALSKDVLREVWSEPTRTVAFVGNIAAISPGITAESTVTANLRSIDVPPESIVLSRLPVVSQTPRELPTFGPSFYVKPSLASELGLRSAVERYSLVTFAPTNVSDARIAQTTEQLELTGFPVAEGNWVNFKVSRTHVRYYSKEDEKVALAVAETLGVRARDFSYIQDAPPAGRVEVWMQGNRNPNPAARQSKQEVSPSERKEAYKSQLEDRLVNSLRRGIHLGGASN